MRAVYDATHILSVCRQAILSPEARSFRRFFSETALPRTHAYRTPVYIWGDLFKLFRVRLDPENTAGRFSSGRVAVCCAYFERHNTTTTTTTIRYDDHAILRISPNSFAAPTTVCRKRPVTVVVADRGGRVVFCPVDRTALRP